MSRAFDLKKVTGPVFLHLLRDELPFPRLFLFALQTHVEAIQGDD